MNTIKKIAKNTTLMFISNIISFTLGFFYVIYTARYLGAEGFGLLSFALAFAGIIGFFADLGLGTLTTREVARNKSLASKYLGNMIVIKIFLSFLTFGLIALFVKIIGYPPNIANVIYLVALSPIFGYFSSIVYSIFQAYEEMEYFAIGQILSSSLMFAGILLAIYLKFDVVGFAFIYFIVSLIIFLYVIIVCLWKFVSPKLEFDLSFWKSTIKEALPFGLTGLFLSIYFWIDSMMLSFMVGNEAVGLYNVAYRFLAVLLFIPTLFSIAIFPAMSRFYISSQDILKIAHRKYFKYLTIIAIPIGVGTTLLSDKIILLLFGSGYEPSIKALQILVWASVFIYMSSTFARLLESSNRQITMTKITLICVFLNVLLNLVTIPLFSYIGASISTVITEFTALLLLTFVSAKIGYGLSKNILLNIIKISLSSLVMGVFIFSISAVNLLIILPLATAIYFISLFVLKGFDNEDLTILKEIIHK